MNAAGGKEMVGEFVSGMTMECGPYPGTVPGLLGDSAARYAESVAMIGEDEFQTTYAALFAWVKRFVAAARLLGIRQDDRVGVSVKNGPRLAAAFLAISSCAVAVPLDPGSPESEADASLARAGISIVLVEDGSDLPVVKAAKKRTLPVLLLTNRGVMPPLLYRLEGTTGREPTGESSPEPDDLALLLQTSGTTGKQKVVPLTHRNIIFAASNICRVVKLSPADRCLNVMPLQYIHGQSALLSTLLSGGSIVCTPGFSETRFYDWVERYHPTWYTASPTIHFAVHEYAAKYRDVIGKFPLRFIRSASAAMPVQLIKDLEADFQVPFVEAYGMTETSPQISSNGLAAAERKLGSVGRPAGPEVGIMDDEGTLLASGTTGEIVTRGTNVMREYENDPAANAAAFTNGWFRTGDLGYLDADGFLFVTGRKKEMINRGGQKVSPGEIDRVLLEHPAVAEAVTFAVPHPRLGEDVAAAVRIRPEARATEDEIRRFVEGRVSSYKVPRRLMIVDAIPKGSSGKIKRIGMAEALGIAPPAAGRAAEKTRAVAPRDELEWKLVRIWEQILHVSPVGVTDNFFSLGGFSLAAVTLFEEIEKLTGRNLPLATLLQAPTVEQLAALLREEHWTPPWKSLVPIQPAGSRPPLYCAHGGGGNVVGFEALARHLGKDQPLYGLQSYGLDGQVPYTRVEDMAAHYLRDILSFQPEGPYFLEGMSFGGLVALEMAQQLQNMGKEVALLALLDTYPKGVHKSLKPESSWRKIELRLSEFLALERADKAVFLKRRAMEYIGRPERVKKQENESKTQQAVRIVTEANLIASLKYHPQPYQGRLTLFWARESFVNSTHRFRMGWNVLAPVALDMHVVPGTHISMFEEPNVQVLAREINNCIDKALHTA